MIPRTGTEGECAVLIEELMRQEGDEREETQQERRGARHGAITPLPLGLDAEMAPRFGEGDFHLPALDKPAHDLRGRLTGIGARERDGIEVAVGIANEHPSDRHDRAPGMIPHGSGRGVFNSAIGLAVPAADGGRRPRRRGIGQDRGQLWQPCPFLAGSSLRPAATRWGGRIQRGVQPEARDHRDPVARECSQQLQRGKATVRHDHDPAIWHPAAHLPYQLACPIGEPLMAVATRRMVALRRGECGQERQCPDPVCPGNRGQEPHTEPPQAGRLHEVAV